MKRKLQLAISRLLGFKLTSENGARASRQLCDPRIAAKIGKPDVRPCDPRIGAKIGKSPPPPGHWAKAK